MDKHCARCGMPATSKATYWAGNPFWFHQQIDIEDQNVDNTYIISVPFYE